MSREKSFNILFFRWVGIDFFGHESLQWILNVLKSSIKFFILWFYETFIFLAQDFMIRDTCCLLDAIWLTGMKISHEMNENLRRQFSHFLSLCTFRESFSRVFHSRHVLSDNIGSGKLREFFSIDSEIQHKINLWDI